MIGVVTCRHKRKEIHEAFIANIEKIREQIPLRLFIATTDQHTYEQSWIVHTQYENRPLGAKWNAVVTLAIADPNIEQFLFLGDDDFISANDVSKLSVFCKRYHHVGTKQVYMVDQETKRTREFTYAYPCAKLIGAGKMLSRQAIEDSAIHLDVILNRALYYGGEEYPTGTQLVVNPRQADFLSCRGVIKKLRNLQDNWRAELFKPEINSGLDHSMDMHLVGAGYLPHAVDLEDGIIDVKSKDNIWSFNRLQSQKGMEKVSFEYATKWVHKDILYKLGFN